MKKLDFKKDDIVYAFIDIRNDNRIFKCKIEKISSEYECKGHGRLPAQPSVLEYPKNYSTKYLALLIFEYNGKEYKRWMELDSIKYNPKELLNTIL